MITMKKKVEKVEKIYKCETCGKESLLHSTITTCEVWHHQETCEHSDFKYESDRDEYDFNIYKRCRKCQYKTFITVDIEEIPEETLKQIYEAQNENN